MTARANYPTAMALADAEQRERIEQLGQALAELAAGIGPEALADCPPAMQPWLGLVRTALRHARDVVEGAA